MFPLSCKKSLQTLIIVLLGVSGGLAGCNRISLSTDATSPEVVTQPSDAVPSSTENDNPTNNSQDWTTLLPGEGIDEIALTTVGTLTYQGNTLLSEIPVSYISDGTVTMAKRLIVSPTSPSGHYSLIKACEGVADGEGQCWSVYLLDRISPTIQKVSIGKYGGLNWVEWSPDGRYVVFLEKMEGTAWFIGLDLQTGDSQIADQLPGQPDLESFIWADNHTFTVPLTDASTFQCNLKINAYQLCNE